MTAEIQYLAPLIGGLYGLYVALGMWDGAAKRIISVVVGDGAAGLGAKGDWEAVLIEAEAFKDDDDTEGAAVTVRNARKFYRQVKSATRDGQNACFVVAMFYVLALLFAGYRPTYELALLLVVIVMLFSIVPIAITVLRVRRHWRKWEDRKDDAASGPGADTGDEYDEPQKP